jgi:hypothetical protein
LIGDPDQAPANTQISRQTDITSATVWNIPASGKSGGFMLFAVFWCAITGGVSAGFIFAGKSGNGFPNAWLEFPFFGVFWAVGLGMFYAACRAKYATHRLSVNRTSITLCRELFGRTKEKSLPTDSVQSVAQVEFYQRNYQPVRGIEIKGNRGKLRFGSTLTGEEKAWLVADLKRVVLGVPSRAAAPVRTEGPSRTRQSHFSIPLPRPGGSALAAGILLTAMGVGFILVGVFVIGAAPGGPGGGGPGFVKTVESFFRFVDGGFRLIWTLISTGMAGIGVSVLIGYIRSRGQEICLQGNDVEVALRTTRSGRVVTERVFPRDSVTGIRASSSGTRNDKTMKRIELLAGGKAQQLVRWLDGEHADAFVAEVRRALF